MTSDGMRTGDSFSNLNITNTEGRRGNVEFWPSMGEFPIYDDFLYFSMTHDSMRNSRYRSVVQQSVAGKTVLDIGTGQDIVWARACAEAGARRVYAIEAMADTFVKAQAKIRSLGLEKKIILLPGLSTQIELPERVDVCVSEIIGNIGSSEGVCPVLEDARQRLMKRNALMIPQRCATRIAAATLPDALHKNLGFNPEAARYVDKLFRKVGHAFDFRLCVNNFPKSALLSNSDYFEDIEFGSRIETTCSRDISLEIAKPGRIDGFLLWINLYCSHTSDPIDSYYEPTSWLPVFFPAFYPGIEVKPGDVIAATCRSVLSADDLHPDYAISGTLQRSCGTQAFHFDSFYCQQHDPRRNRIYDLLLPQATAEIV